MVFRFAVRNDSCMSSQWRIWINQKDDLYIAPRNIGHLLKASLHASNQYHFAFSKEYFDSGNIENADETRFLGVNQVSVAEDRMQIVFYICIVLTDLTAPVEAVNNCTMIDCNGKTGTFVLKLVHVPNIPKYADMESTTTPNFLHEFILSTGNRVILAWSIDDKVSVIETSKQIELGDIRNDEYTKKVTMCMVGNHAASYIEHK